MVITGKTQLIGILGDPVSHSLSPVMHNAAYAAMEMDLCYVPLHVAPAALPAAISGLKAMQFIGANVTIPHKVSAVALMDSLADSAIRTGAVNTIVKNDGMLVGHNTDGQGFIRSLDEKVAVEYGRAPVIIFGAGGAARSVAVALADQGVPGITIVNRSRERAEEFAMHLAASFPELKITVMTPEQDHAAQLAVARLVINATPMGMEGQLKRPPVLVDRLTEQHVVCDLVYTRTQETPLLAAAQEKGAITLGGLGMLLHQGAVAIHLWTGQEPPIDVMRGAIES